MRIILSSAIIAAISETFPVSADSSATKEHFVTDDTIQSQLAQDVKSSSQSVEPNMRRRGGECDTFTSPSSTAAAAALKTQSDVGALGCTTPNQSCQADVTSHTGGRCTTTTAIRFTQRPQKPQIPAFPKRRHKDTIVAKQQRHGRNLQSDSTVLELEEEPFVCPTNCPEEFCDCAQLDGDAKVCAPQLHSVCEANLVAECVPDAYLNFYEETYCPFAKCYAAENKPYEECACEYYKDYCKVYYAFEESMEKCTIGTCCDGEAVGSKFVCLPGLEPTESPTGSPTNSTMPSMVPTVSTAPTITQSPTVSTAPSSSPTVSVAPTISLMPTIGITESPTLKPTTSPTTEPTDVPSTLPSSDPTGLPSSSPTISAEPTRSAKPSTSPSISSAPSTSSAPSGMPSTSTSPSYSPSTLPTVTKAPSSSPSTTPLPSLSPTEEPSENPTASPTDTPTMPPTTAIPTDPPSNAPPTIESPTPESPTPESPTPESTTPESPVNTPLGGSVPLNGPQLPETGEQQATPSRGASGASALRCGLMALFAGVGGALMMFV